MMHHAILKFWKIEQSPFCRVGYDSRRFYPQLWTTHINRLSYAVFHSPGLALISGPWGSGKTSLAHILLQTPPPVNGERVLYVVPPRSQQPGWLEQLMTKRLVGVEAESSLAAGLDALTSRNGMFSLILDACENLSSEDWGAIKALKDAEAVAGRCMGLLAIGHDTMFTELQKYEGLTQKIGYHWKHKGLEEGQVAEYIQWCSAAVGLVNPFSSEALSLIAQSSHGNPTLINNLGERCLMIGAENSLEHLDRATVENALTQLKY